MLIQKGRPRRPLPWARPARSAGAAGARSALQTTKGGLFVGLLIWIYIVTLCVRWDWLDPTAVLTEVVVGQTYTVSPTLRFIKLSLLFFSSVVVIRNFSMSLLVLQNLNKGFLAFLFLVPVSVLWSISPANTLTRFLALISVVLLCLAATVSNWNPRRYQHVLLPLVTLIIGGSMAVGLALPNWVIEQEEALKGAWHGLVASKNDFGALTAFGVILWAHALLFEKAKWWFGWPMFLVSFTCLLKSHSSTALLACVFALMFLVLIHGLPQGARRLMPYFVGMFTTIVLIYGLAVLRLLPGLDLLFAPIAAITGKDTTFTNRAAIWDIIKEHIALNPLLGTGSGAYWIGPDPNSPSFMFLGRMGFYPFECHNGYLEIVNDLGYVGLCTLMAFIWIYVRQCLELLKTHRSEAALLLSVFFWQVLLNLSESEWLNSNVPFSFTVMTLATLSLARLRIQQTLQRSPRAAGARR
jgi:exopolysaccharide production protein ExoQ